MDSVYCVFKAFGDGDGFTSYDLIGVYNDYDKCINEVTILDIPMNIDIVNNSMNYQNNYTIVTERSKCSGNCRYGHFGGYVIEKVEINKVKIY